MIETGVVESIGGRSVYISLSQAIYHCGGWLAIAGSENDRHRGLGCLVREMQQQNFSHQSTNIILL